METNSKVKSLSENPRQEVVPSPTPKYTTVKRALLLLQSAVTLIPVPLIPEAIVVALGLIEVIAEEASAAGKMVKQLKQLQDYACHMMMVMVNDELIARVDNDISMIESDERLVKAEKDSLSNLKTFIEELKIDDEKRLDEIDVLLDEIASYDLELNTRLKLGLAILFCLSLLVILLFFN